MFHRLLPLLLLIAWAPSVLAQQPPPAQPAPAPAPETDAVEEQIRRFYADYWKAWDERNPDGVAAGLAPDFAALTYVDPQGVVRADREAAVTGIRHFFAAVAGRETLWGRSLLSVVVRNETEAIAAVRTDFSLKEAGRETEISLEVLRKEPAGGWRLVRRWSEKGVFPLSARAGAPR